MTVSTQGWPPPGLTASDGSESNASGLSDTEGQRWYSCDRCGQLFPEFETIVEQFTGLRVCLTGPKDFDKPNPDDIRSRGFSRLFSTEEE